MYKRLTCSRIRVEVASPAYLRLKLIYIIILPCINDAVPYMRGTRIPRLLVVRNYLNNYFAYKRLTRSRIGVELASLAYLWLRII